MSLPLQRQLPTPEEIAVKVLRVIPLIFFWLDASFQFCRQLIGAELNLLEVFGRRLVVSLAHDATDFPWGHVIVGDLRRKGERAKKKKKQNSKATTTHLVTD